MTLLVTDETPRPTRTKRASGAVAYTVVSVAEIDALPWRHLCALADVTGNVNPMGYYTRHPAEFRPITII